MSSLSVLLLATAVLHSHAVPRVELKEELFEGDILLTPTQRAAVTQRKTVPLDAQLWPKQADKTVLVPYVFNAASANDKMKKVVRAAVKVWEAATCIKFKEHTSLPESTPHISFGSGGGGCFSALGWTRQLQKINLDDGCLDGPGTTVHELGHALGFFHEQSRSDRDSYLRIAFENVKPGMEGQFKKYNTRNLAGYDYSSLMHYGDSGFSSNGKPTMQTLDPIYQNLIGQREVLSFRDVKTMNLLYKCAEAQNCGADTCQNEGYLGKACACVCPPGTSGAKCETKTKDYTDAVLAKILPYNAKVTTAGKFTSPQYPKFPTGKKYIQVIESKEKCEEVEVIIDEFKLPDCYYGNIHITYDGVTHGNKGYCGSAGPGSKVFRGARVVLTHVTWPVGGDCWQCEGRGYSGNVKFVRKAGCTTKPGPPTKKPTVKPTKKPTVKPTVKPSVKPTVKPTVKPATGITITNSGSSVDLKISPEKKNDCKFSVEKMSDGVYKLSATISPMWSYITCTIPLATDEPRFMTISRVSDLDNSKLQIWPSSTYGAEKLLPSNVDLYYSGAVNKNRKVEMTVRLVNSKCHKVVHVNGKGTGSVTIKSPLCEVWIMAPEKKKLQLTLRGGSSGGPCDKNGQILLTYEKSHKFTSFYQICPNQIGVMSLKSETSSASIRYQHKNPKAAPLTVEFSLA